MSDSRRRYNSVKAKLRQLLPEEWVKGKERMTNLSLLVSAISKAKDLTQHNLAAEMPLTAQDTSLAQRQRRWLMNTHLNERMIYEPIIRPFLEAMGQTTLPLVLDTTEAGTSSHLLTLAVGYQRRAVPLAWQAGHGNRGRTSGDEQIDLLQYARDLLPPQSDVILLGDGEFGHVQLLHWLACQGWSYCLRVASDTCILYENRWCRIDSFALSPGETLWLEQVWLTQAQPLGPLNLCLTWDDVHQQPLPLVSNLPLLPEVQHWYRKRFWIEPLFGDIKGHGFDLQTSRLRHPERLSRLMLAVSLAYLWLCFLGSLALMVGHAKFVDRSDRRDRSVFTIGRQWLNRLLKLDKPILVNFMPYPFLKLLPPSGVG